MNILIKKIDRCYNYFISVMEDIQNLVKIHEWKENKQIVKLTLKLDSTL